MEEEINYFGMKMGKGGIFVPHAKKYKFIGIGWREIKSDFRWILEEENESIINEKLREIYSEIDKLEKTVENIEKTIPELLEQRQKNLLERLEKLLANPCNERQLEMIRLWLEKVLKQRGDA